MKETTSYSSLTALYYGELNDGDQCWDIKKNPARFIVFIYCESEKSASPCKQPNFNCMINRTMLLVIKKKLIYKPIS